MGGDLFLFVMILSHTGSWHKINTAAVHALMILHLAGYKAGMWCVVGGAVVSFTASIARGIILSCVLRYISLRGKAQAQRLDKNRPKNMTKALVRDMK